MLQHNTTNIDQRGAEGRLVMRLGSKSKGSMMVSGNNSRKRPYGMMLVLALGAALLSVVMLHKLRERRVFSLLLHDRENQLFTTQLLLQKERENFKELKGKLADLKAKTFSLRSQKMDLTNKLMKIEATTTYLKEKQREMETALEDKQNQVNGIPDREAESIKANLQIASLTDLLKQREAEIEEMKQRALNLSPPVNTTAENVNLDDETSKSNGIQDAVSQNGQVAKPADPDDGGKSVEERQVVNSSEKASNQQPRDLAAGQWVKFETNVDDEGLKYENQSTDDQHVIDASRDQQVEKLVVSEDSKQLREGGEKGQESMPAVTKEEDLENVASSGNGNEQLVTPNPNGTSKLEEKETRGHGNRKRTRRRRRQRVLHKGDSVKQENEQLESSQNDENSIVRDQNADNSIVEANKEGDQTEIQENPQTTDNASNGKEQADLLLPNGERSDVFVNSQDGGISIINMENAQNSHVDDGKRSKGGIHDDNGLETQDDGTLGTKSQINPSTLTEAKEERAISSKEQLQTHQVIEGGASSQDHNGESYVEIHEEQIKKSTDGQSEVSDKPQDDEGKNKSDGNQKATTADSSSGENSSVERRDGEVTKETVDVNMISEPEKTEAGSTTESHEGETFIGIEREGQITKSTDGQSEMSEKSQVEEDKNKSGENKGETTVDSTREEDTSVEMRDQEVIQKTVVANTISTPEQTDAGSNTEDNERERSTEIAHGGQITKSTEEQIEISEKPQDDEVKNKSHENKGDTTVDSAGDENIERQDKEVMKEIVVPDTISKQEPTEGSGITEDQESQITGDKTEKADTSVVRDSKDNDRELIKNVE